MNPETKIIRVYTTMYRRYEFSYGLSCSCDVWCCFRLKHEHAIRCLKAIPSLLSALSFRFKAPLIGF
jgi:hypothetical protein